MIVPDTAPKTKADAIERLGGEVIKVTFDEWWETLVNRGHPSMDGFFVMWPYIRSLLSGTIVVSVSQVAQAVRTLAERCRIVSEGAGAAAFAAACTGALEGQRTVCIVSGGNIDMAVLNTILRGETP